MFPAGSIDATVTVFLPGASATVAVHDPSVLTVVFTPLTMTVEPGSAFPETTAPDPVTVAPFNVLMLSVGATVSFTTVILTGQDALHFPFNARNV